ncbi:hypothetical protein [Candidatus Binatus sp.]|uniref:hypothetical protein n=1 Tax=Candidatus Binatus sp. TaxID=2811406 RepID=UPI003CB90BCD
MLNNHPRDAERDMASPFFTNFTKLTFRQRVYRDAVLSGKSKTEAKRIAKYAESSNIARIETPSLKAAFSRMIRQYVPAHVLGKTIAEGVQACETKFFQHEGKVTDSRDVIAWGPRATFAKLAAEYGQYVEPEVKGGDVNVAVGFTLINGITKPKRD